MTIKRTVFLLTTTLLAGRAWCQWITCASGSQTCTNVGTNIGIGTTSPGRVLEVSAADWNTGIKITGTTSDHSWLLAVGVAAGDGKFALYDYGAGAERLVVDSSGNVGIGTPNPVHPLQVAGTIGAEEVVVSSTGADYVFRPDYRLTPLTEVGAFIQEYHHLPDVPSAAEMKEKGVNLSDMQTKLLAKIEELTLHMIREDERIAKAEEQNIHLEQQNVALQNEIQAMRKRMAQ